MFILLPIILPINDISFIGAIKITIIVDAISGLPITETTTPANVPDFKVALMV